MSMRRIDKSAAGPRRSVIDGQVFEEHSLPDQDAHDRYRRATLAHRRGAFGGCTVSKLIPHGAVFNNRNDSSGVEPRIP